MRFVFFIGFSTLACLGCSEGELHSMRALSSGAKLYRQHCANCHQEDGSGLANLIPPLQQSDYLKANYRLLPCQIRKGLPGGSKVNGKVYRQAMPANARLSDAEIADIYLFVNQKFVGVDVNESDSLVFKALKTCD